MNVLMYILFTPIVVFILYFIVEWFKKSSLLLFYVLYRLRNATTTFTTTLDDAILKQACSNLTWQAHVDYVLGRVRRNRVKTASSRVLQLLY